MKEIKTGYTNRKFKDGNKIIIQKNHTGFNHKINYALLQEFDFVPKLIKETTQEVVFEGIDGHMLEKPTNDDLQQLARHIRTLHKSNVIFPKNNFRQRYKHYLNVAHAKGIKMPEVEHNGKAMNSLVTKMNVINPCHNDLGWQNFIKDENGKIGIVDGEYATMGDKHFDITFFLESNYLSPAQEQIFLEAYNSMDDYNAYIDEWLDRYRLFVNGFTLTGANAQTIEVFPLEDIKMRIHELLNK